MAFTSKNVAHAAAALKSKYTERHKPNFISKFLEEIVSVRGTKSLFLPLDFENKNFLCHIRLKIFQPDTLAIVNKMFGSVEGAKNTEK